GMLSIPPETAERFQNHGWKLVNPEQATVSCGAFADFIRGSAGEFTVAKEIYAGLPSGWFSDRSAAYLASGRPVVAQDSGFDRWLPTGQGLFTFHTIDEAADALAKIERDPVAHSTAARQLAEQSFSSDRVLGELLDRIL